MKALILIVASLAFLAAPAFTTPFTGYDPALFPVRIDRPFIQPAAYAFAIWGPIFLWLMASAVAGLWRRGDTSWERPFLPHLAALLLGILWLAIAPTMPLSATLAITLMAAAAITAFLLAAPTGWHWLQQAPLGLFAGWLTAAAGVSIGVMLAGYGWLSNTATALAMLALVLAVALAIQLRRPAMPSYSAAVAWAAVGVFVVNRLDQPLVAWSALAGAGIIAAAAALAFARR